MKLLKNKKFLLAASGIAAVILSVVFGIDEDTAKKMTTSCANLAATQSAQPDTQGK